MSVLLRLASALGRRDEVPNQELAAEIVAGKRKEALKELVDGLNNKDKNIQSDCIKVLYEIGEREPKLIADYIDAFTALLDNNNNRLVWGAMTALDYITSIKPEIVYKNLSKILAIADKGSVITKDHAVSILIKLAAIPQYTDSAMTLLLDQLKISATNQLPMYAENALPIITGKYKADFSKVLLSRLNEIEKESKKKRVEKVLKKLEKMK